MIIRCCPVDNAITPDADDCRMQVTGAETRVEKVLAHTSARVVFLVPDGLPDGDCTLEVRILPHDNRAVWKGALLDRLTV